MKIDEPFTIATLWCIYGSKEFPFFSSSFQFCFKNRAQKKNEIIKDWSSFLHSNLHTKLQKKNELKIEEPTIFVAIQLLLRFPCVLWWFWCVGWRSICCFWHLLRPREYFEWVTKTKSISNEQDANKFTCKCHYFRIRNASTTMNRTYI